VHVSVDNHSFSVTSANIAVNDIALKIDSTNYTFVTDRIDLYSTT